MSDIIRAPFFLRPRFLLFCLYVMCYVALRGYGEILHQEAMVDNRGRREYVVGSNRAVPRWRRQMYRAFFSPLMVAEEEGRNLLSRGRGLVRDAGDYGEGFFSE